MSNISRSSVGTGIIAMCLAGLVSSLSAADAQGPQHLDALLARYDRLPDGPARDQLATEVDAAAHQKYATVSRLHWYTEFEAAKAAAGELRRPILHLRMLGRLDEDLSCANSRLFRATLYANQDVSRFLREHFILYWSSERPVPRVTIDYGNGRRLERTTAGNSAHYVLDEAGHVLDVLPGLYAPVAFRRELEHSLALAARVRGTSDIERARLIADYHRAHAIAAQHAWNELAGTPWIVGITQLLTESRVERSIAAAQRATVSKAMIELNDLRVIAKGLAPAALSEADIQMWASAGQRLYGLGDLQKAEPRQISLERVGRPTPMLSQPDQRPRVLDDASRALVIRLHNSVPAELRATGILLDTTIARLEQTIVADTAINQLRLRPQIDAEFVRRGGRVDFAALNAWIYAEVFHTPREDAWLGLLPRDVFTGLPGDGVVMR
jgi:hypothetical protein